MNVVEKARLLRPFIEKAAVSLEDADAIEAVELFPRWAVGVEYKVDDRIGYNGLLYKVIQAHTSQSDWTPDITPALFVRVDVEEWPEWRQPTGAHDAYNKGDKVSHNSARWVSVIDANVWEPSDAVPTLWEKA